MRSSPSGFTTRMLALAAAVTLPGAAVATPSLLDEGLRTPGRAALTGGLPSEEVAPDLSVRWSPVLARAGDPQAASTKQGQGSPDKSAGGSTPDKGSADPALEFDLLGVPPPPPKVNEGSLRLRRTMLTVHQGLGLGLVALQLGTTVVGQLNYSDRFAGGPSTAKYQQPHAILAYTTLAAFTAVGALALLAPSPVERSGGFDRVTLHKISMFTAAAGMLAQGLLGVATRNREGYLNQPDLAAVHLAVGYVTLAAMAVGVGALVY